AVLNGQPSIYIFYWPPAMEGLPDRPIGFFLLFILVVFAIHQLMKRQKLMQGGPLLIPYLFFLLCVVWGVVHGLSSGGNLKILVNEVRSFWYLFLGYVLAFNIFRSKVQVRTVFWFIIVCAGIKALEGTYIYFFILHSDLSGNREIMSHEESFFWTTVLLLIVIFSLHSRYKPQLFTALALTPFIGISLIANNRRAGFVALIIGILVAWLLVFLASPQKRRLLLFILISCSLLGGGYIAAFSQSDNAFGAPARSVVSVFRPDPQDISSNVYRDIENFDLEYTVKQNPLGLGFGKPFLQPQLLPDISSLDPVYLYIPHNTIYWIWMRLGAPGYLALWFLFGSVVVRGCIITRQLKDKTLQLMAIYIVAVTVMEVIVAYADYQLSFYRNVLYIGMLTGILMKLPIIDAKEEKQADESARAHVKSSYS
ncbi:MAG TPA: O-antigen ligase family protein, partial [Ktedonobacteraceae bacterium]|nr:O-antigen ligase family protein [Ktedonobacteraceae bacterium]